ncbi:MAG: thioesterase [Duncaniella sp.]|nr:thioesterase [Muribaculum sp.]MCM1254804.1 thioesterase [Duncaniella sp.]
MKLFNNEFFLTAAEVNAQREMPLSRLVTLIIDTATGHANAIGIGFDRMISYGISWVLSRLTIDINNPLTVNRTYRIETWIENLNRMFSERNFEIIDVATGESMVYAHSTWMAINMETRRPSDLTMLTEMAESVNGRIYPGEKGGKLLPFTEIETEKEYRFAVSDIDVNRHVTTRRYIDLIVDQWPLHRYEANSISRFEIAFKREAHYDELSRTVSAPHEGSPELFDVMIEVNRTPCALARIQFKQR